MTNRKSLNDILSSDRSVARSAQGRDGVGSGKMADIFGDSDEDWRDNIEPIGSHRKTNINTSNYPTYGKGNGGSGGSGNYGPRCYETHPPLTLPGTTIQIFGGSCSHPVVKDADVYIGFDMSMPRTERSYPWKKGQEFLFKITDFQAPENPEEFKKLVFWAKTQLEAGKKIHCGCIGGHGRTGTFLAALVSQFGELDAINYVRKNYCQKVVESNAQVKFLADHFGIKPAHGAKQGPKTSMGAPKGQPDYPMNGKQKRPVQKKDRTIQHMAGKSVFDEIAH